MNTTTFFGSRQSLLGVASLIGFAVAFSGTPAQAQQSELDALRQQIAELQARLDKLETAQSDAKTAIKAATPTVASAGKTPITVSGLLQVQYNSAFSQNPNNNVGADTFRLRRGELRITAPQITSRASGTIMFDLAKNGTGAASPLQEIVVSYQLDKSANSPKYIDIGQYKIPIGYEGDLVSSGSLDLTERALAFRARDLSAGGYGDIREEGARLRGSLGTQLDYQVGVFNGFGERQNQNSIFGPTGSNDSKAVIGRLVYKPNGGPWWFGVSAGKGDTRVTTPTERHVYNAFVAYKRDKWSFQTEYFNGKQDIRNAAADVRDITSYYAHLGYLIAPKVQLVGRYDRFKFGTNTVGGASTPGTLSESTIGLNYLLKGNTVKLQTDLVWANGTAGAPTITGVGAGNSTQVRSQVQVAF